MSPTRQLAHFGPIRIPGGKGVYQAQSGLSREIGVIEEHFKSLATSQVWSGFFSRI